MDDLPRTANGRRPHASRRTLAPELTVTVAGLPCADGTQTLIDRARSLGDLRREQALESALRKRLTTLDHVRQVNRRVMRLRPAGAAPTESLVETPFVQLCRTVPGLPGPVRQLWIEAAQARLDTARPDLGRFVGLDGEHHKDQPLYDARRETASWRQRAGCAGGSPGPRSSASRARRRGGRATSAGAQQLGQPVGQIERLAAVQPRVACGEVPQVQL